MPFPEAQRLDLPAVEEQVLDRWKEDRIFARSMEERPTDRPFTFYEGPPTANGKPGIHHVLARTIKDAFCRYKTMQGYRVDRKGGWDTHGLPVEIEVEKELGLEGRHQVEEFGVARYNDACRQSVQRYKALWDEITERMGYWVDLDHPYVTFQNEYIESVWWLLKRLHEKGLLYRGHKIQWYSPGNETVLSSHEVSLGYKEVQDPSIYVRAKVKGEDAYFLAWTTTPWTIPSNAAMVVGPSIAYVKVRHETEDGSELVYVAAALADKVLGEGTYEVVEELTGEDLVGKTYEPMLDTFVGHEGTENAWRVVAADYVTTEDGTGIVHTAPAFGADDHATGQREGLPLLNPIEPDGTFAEGVPLVGGMWFKDADNVVVRALREKGLLLRRENYLHNYPHDWRKGTPLMSYPVESWFARTTDLKDRMIALNETINWQPEAIGRGRFGEWLQNNVDWALSRRRYWGTPLPIWVSDEDPDYVEVVGSMEELEAKAGALPRREDGSIDLHRPFVDELTWPAPEEVGGTMRRIEDLVDVWFDSGSMPFAQWHYPFENEDAFERNFPADFIAEGVDQTRGWFYTLHAIATMVEDSVAYKNVVVNGLVLDAEGEKMSKSKGNAVDPFATIQEHGADVVRWTMMAASPPWESTRFSERLLVDTYRKFFSTLANVYSFFATYANIDGYTYRAGEAPPAEGREELDRWILSRLHGTAEAARTAYDAYDATKAARAVEAFVEELSNWYVRRSRRRFWAERSGAEAASKKAAYATVWECLEGVARLMAPIAPFYAERLYTDLHAGAEADAPDSVHLARFPEAEALHHDAALEHRMDLARTVVGVVLSLRAQEQVGVRQPLPEALVVTGRGVEQEALEAVEGIILDEVNVKRLRYVDTASDVVSRSAKPNFKALGPRLGARMKPIAMQVRTLGDDAIEDFLRTGHLVLDVDGEEIVLGEEDVEVVSEGVSGWHVGQDQTEEGRAVTVALDTQIDEALRLEGLARECVNRLQNLRKDAGYDVADRIHVAYAAEGAVAEALAQHGAAVRNETLALSLASSPTPEGEASETFDLGDGGTVTFAVRRAAGDDLPATA